MEGSRSIARALSGFLSLSGCLKGAFEEKKKTRGSKVIFL